MMWEDLLIDRQLTDSEITSTLATLFAVSLEKVMVVEDIVEAPVAPNVAILCERMVVQGDFVMRLSIYLRDANLEQHATIATVERFCSMLQCRCLVSDNSPNPYTRLLVRGIGDARPVSLDAQKLDENDEFTIDKLAQP